MSTDPLAINLKTTTTELLVALNETLTIIVQLYSCEHIEAQHDETGRIWNGPRKKKPRRFNEVSNTYGVDPNELIIIISSFRSLIVNNGRKS